MRPEDKLHYLMQTSWSRDFSYQEFIWLAEDAKLQHSVTKEAYMEFCKVQEDEMAAAFNELESASEELFK
jgi:hypothetical protein